MVTKQENDLITRVDDGSALGRLMRENYWIPFALSENLVAGDDPTPVTLFGENFVAFRAEDDRIGFLDELCPHRRASLLLGRVDGNGLRCIYHGWKVDVSGVVVEAPTQAVRAEQFCASVPVARFPIVEAGGMVWVWLGSDHAPDFPDLPFTEDKGVNVSLTYSVVPCNWLQGLEGGLDSVHTMNLHQSWTERVLSRAVGSSANGVRLSISRPPLYETEGASFGLRTASLRRSDDGNTFTRVTHWFFPLVIVVPTGIEDRTQIFAFTPIDDTHHAVFFGHYGKHRQPTQQEIGAARDDVEFDPRNFASVDGDRLNRWGQNREAMKAGHFSGFDTSAIEEDIAVQMSMGPIVDRSKENLSGSDGAITAARRLILDSLAAADRGELPPGSAFTPQGVSIPHPFEAILPHDTSWRTVEAVSSL